MIVLILRYWILCGKCTWSFGLPCAFPLLQRPICRTYSFLLDFLVPFLRFNVQSAVLTRSFWTSSCRPSASRSNLLDFLFPFGLPRAFPPLQRPIHLPPPQKGVEFFAPLRSAQSRGPPDLVRPCPKTRLCHVLSINKTPLWSIAKGSEEAHASSLPFAMDQRGVEPLSENPFPVLLLS